jgi:hypothetical protein
LAAQELDLVLNLGVVGFRHGADLLRDHFGLDRQALLRAVQLFLKLLQRRPVRLEPLGHLAVLALDLRVLLLEVRDQRAGEHLGERFGRALGRRFVPRPRQGEAALRFDVLPVHVAECFLADVLRAVA